MNTKLYSTTLALLVAGSCLADNVPALKINKSDGESAVVLSELLSIKYTESDMVVNMKDGTVNTLIDCSGGKQKAALYCKGHLEIDKSGTLNVTGNTKHAISAKEYIQLKKSEGRINILGAVSDGIHCGQYFLSNGYTVSIKNIGGDGIQAELSEDDPYEEDYPDGSVTIQGGTYDIEVTATEASAIKADTDITINSSKMPTVITILATGDDGRGIDANGNVTISDDGTEVKITNSGAASKAVKVGNSENIGTFTLNGGTLTANISGTMVLRDLSQRLPLLSAVARITSSAMTTA